MRASWAMAFSEQLYCNTGAFVIPLRESRALQTKNRPAYETPDDINISCCQRWPAYRLLIGLTKSRLTYPTPVPFWPTRIQSLPRTSAIAWNRSPDSRRPTRAELVVGAARRFTVRSATNG